MYCLDESAWRMGDGTRRQNGPCWCGAGRGRRQDGHTRSAPGVGSNAQLLNSYVAGQLLGSYSAAPGRTCSGTRRVGCVDAVCGCVFTSLARGPHDEQAYDACAPGCMAGERGHGGNGGDGPRAALAPWPAVMNSRPHHATTAPGHRPPAPARRPAPPHRRQTRRGTRTSTQWKRAISPYCTRSRVK